jgi:hypothetical protein
VRAVTCTETRARTAIVLLGGAVEVERKAEYPVNAAKDNKEA